MQNDIFYNPTKIIFGKDTHKEVGKYAKKYSDKVLLHYGSRHAVESGLIDEVKQSLEKEGIKVYTLGGVVGNPRLSKAKEGVEICKKNGIGLVLAVGGGSVIDSSKAISIGAKCDGDFWQKHYVLGEEPDEVLPVATVLTLPGAGSESSSGSVITNDETGQKRAFDNDILRPVFSVLNPELTYSLPAYFTAAGVVDAIAHIFERYFTNTQNVDTGDRLCEGLIKSLMRNGRIAVREPHNYAARAEVMWACKLAHDNTVGVGREQDWASHMMEHELSAKYDVSHGAGLAVIFPAWMKYVYTHDVVRFAQIANRVFDVDYDFRDPEWTARQGIKCFMRFCESIQMPTSLTTLGVQAENDIDELAKNCADNNGGSCGAFVKLYEEVFKNIYELAL